jgi:hypothetical protein
MNITSTFIEAAVGAAAVAIVAGSFKGVQLLSKMQRDLKTFGPSLQALYRVQPHVLDALQYQNAALREIGANGSTECADDAIRAGRKVLERRLEERIGGEVAACQNKEEAS